MIITLLDNMKLGIVMSHNAKLQGQPHPRAHCQEFNPYILEIQVDCKTPAILLEEADLSPKEVNILAIDAEGLDVQILQAFLKLLACRLGSCFSTAERKFLANSQMFKEH